MEMLYNSDAFAVMQVELPGGHDARGEAQPARGGFEIVDKLGRKEIFLEGLLAESFKHGVQKLVAGDPSEEALDDFIAGYTELAQAPLTLH